jgi:hypothetical protein
MWPDVMELIGSVDECPALTQHLHHLVVARECGEMKRGAPLLYEALSN